MIAVIKVGKIHTLSFTICDSLFFFTNPSQEPKVLCELRFMYLFFSAAFRSVLFCDPLVTFFVQGIPCDVVFSEISEN